MEGLGVDSNTVVELRFSRVQFSKGSFFTSFFVVIGTSMVIFLFLFSILYWTC